MAAADSQRQASIAEFMADPARAMLAEKLTEGWESLDAPENFFENARRSSMYEFSAPEGEMLYCRNCQQVEFFGPGDSYPCLVIKGSGRIRVPQGVSVRIFAGKDGVARWM